MQTSILNRLSGPLCNALTGRADGYQTLDYLEGANLFLVPLKEDRQWYRYHSLFARFLRSRLQRRDPDQAMRLHRVASHWLENEEEFPDAAQHAMTSGDVGYAAGLMDRCAPDLALVGRPAGARSPHCSPEYRENQTAPAFVRPKSRTSAFRVTSARTARARPPEAAISVATRSMLAWFRALTTTFAPPRASVRAIPSPIPFPDPVIMAVFPVNSMVISSSAMRARRYRPR